MLTTSSHIQPSLHFPSLSYIPFLSPPPPPPLPLFPSPSSPLPTPPLVLNWKQKWVCCALLVGKRTCEGSSQGGSSRNRLGPEAVSTAGDPSTQLLQGAGNAPDRAGSGIPLSVGSHHFMTVPFICLLIWPWRQKGIADLGNGRHKRSKEWCALLFRELCVVWCGWGPQCLGLRMAGVQGGWGPGYLRSRVSGVQGGWSLGCLDEEHDRTYQGRLGPDHEGCFEPCHRP